MLKEAPNTATTLICAFAILALVGVLMFLLPIQLPLSARTVVLDKASFFVNELIKGDFNLMLQEGELIPAGTNVTINVDNQAKELSLEEFVQLSNLNFERQEGNFYVKNTELLGYGFGYGWQGKHLSYPAISFKLKVVEKNSSDPVFTTSSNSGSSNPSNHNSNPTVNGFSIAKFFKQFFSILGFTVYKDSNGKIIEASCTAQEPFVYELEEGETVEIIEGSVISDSQVLSDEIIAISQEATILTVSTDHTIEKRGFGQEYLQDITHEVALSFDSLDLHITDPGDYILTVILTYQGEELAKESIPLIVTEEIEEEEIEEEIPEQLAKVNGKKVEDDPEFETTIWSAERDGEEGTFTLIFSHNSLEVQPIWIEEIEPLDYELSKDSSSANENVTLIVYFKERLPKFRLHVGTTSEIFEFGDPFPLVPADAALPDCPPVPGFSIRALKPLVTEGWGYDAMNEFLDTGIWQGLPAQPMTEGTRVSTYVNLHDSDGRGEFSEGNGYPDWSFPGVDPDESPTADPAAGDDDNNFATEVLGCIQLTAGLHTIGANSDDGTIIEIGGVEIGRTDEWKGTSNVDFVFEVEAEGYYSLRARHLEGSGGASLELHEVLMNGEKLDADLNEDGKVDYLDLEIMANEWLASGAGLTADLDEDGDIDFKDYAVLADSWLDELLWLQRILLNDVANGGSAVFAPAP